ncbi:MAG TPA: ABC transporter ATP-binding protein [Spirochaetia bacterium]|nr:ABC transporter ATP-binding protein [Spirochaetia bacterium]
MPEYLEIRNLTKQYARVKGIDDVSFSCKEGSFIVILGPSGAGKTTTLKIIAGILQETSGDVLRRGESLRSVSPQVRNVSMTFEDYALYPTFSIYENIASPLRVRGVAREEVDARVKRTASLLGIDEHLDKLPSQISGGQKQRTALARCLIRDAEIYLLDEPIAHLDAKLRHRMRGEFKRIHKDLGKTMIYVTHDYREALALADTVVVLNKGKVEQIGPPDEVFSRPRNVFVATLLGEPPMNLVHFDEARSVGGALSLSGKDRSVALRGIEAGPAGGTVTLGFRHFSAALQPQAGENCLEGSVYVSEQIEDSRVYSLMVGDDLVKVLTPRDTRFDINQRVSIRLDPRAVYLFDGASGERIGAGA